MATPLYPPDIGGPATYAAFLGQELPQKGIFLEVVSFGSVRLFPNGLRHFLYFLKVLVKGFRADVIYALDPVSVGFPALLASQILGKKFFIKIVGDYAWEQGVSRYGVKENLDEFLERENYPRAVRRWRKIQRFVANSAERIIVPSNYLKGVVTKWKIDPEKISVVYNALSSRVGIPSREEIRRELNLSGKIIMSAGRLVKWKGFSEIMDAVSELSKEFPDIRLLIAGDGPEREALSNKIKDFHLEDRVVMLGQIPQEELLHYIRASNCFVLNSTYEGFSHQLLEVASVGTPIIATDVGGNTEFIRSGVNGILIKPHQVEEMVLALRKILVDSGVAEKFSSEARLNVENQFGKDRVIDNLLKILQA